MSRGRAAQIVCTQKESLYQSRDFGWDTVRLGQNPEIPFRGATLRSGLAVSQQSLTNLAGPAA